MKYPVPKIDYDKAFDCFYVKVTDYDTKEIIYKKVKVSEAERRLNTSRGAINKFLRTKRKTPYYTNTRTKKKYVFEKIKE